MGRQREEYHSNNHDVEDMDDAGRKIDYYSLGKIKVKQENVKFNKASRNLEKTFKSPAVRDGRELWHMSLENKEQFPTTPEYQIYSVYDAFD